MLSVQPGNNGPKNTLEIRGVPDGKAASNEAIYLHYTKVRLLASERAKSPVGADGTGAPALENGGIADQASAGNLTSYLAVKPVPNGQTGGISDQGASGNLASYRAK
jgi:hypothetical protein